MSTPHQDPVSAPPVGTLSEDLRGLLPVIPGTAVTVRDIFVPLAGRGNALLAMVVTLPFCLPIPLVGLSTPFGLMAGFFGLRLVLGLPPWLPHSWLVRPVPYVTVKSLVEHGVVFARRMEKILHPRLTFLASGETSRRICGLVILWMAFLLALPLPIPGTNILPALPVVLLGLGLMERDGLFVLAGYTMAGVATAVFSSLAHFIILGVQKIFQTLLPFWEKVIHLF